ncbi:transcriptional regulator [Psychromonas sp. KJ10-10]|uniref:transcriptional regulator n=1 Tax=Psychromonas sp. KJ10-10 TaxID=3391823 RepID=UPI0039B5401A
MKIENLKQLGQLAKIVRQSQSLDQSTAGLLSGNGLTFMSQFENGKETVEIGRVLKLLEQLGIELSVDLPPGITDKFLDKIKQIKVD